MVGREQSEGTRLADYVTMASSSPSSSNGACNNFVGVVLALILYNNNINYNNNNNNSKIVGLGVLYLTTTSTETATSDRLCMH